ncbi:MAG TPA: hypothetical protein VNB90_01310 [Cytophagaceae bacterium]|jgi:hypothetical protein|nr:hypothetical protein [Cytophagaceae bacterium]
MKIFPTFFFFFFIMHASAQYMNTSPEEAQQLKKRILLIVLPQEDKHYLAQLAEENPADSSVYLEDLAGQQYAMKKAVTEQWKFNDSLSFCSLKEARSLLKNFPEKYAILRMEEQLQDKVYVSWHQRVAQTTSWAKHGETLYYSANKRYNLPMLGITVMVIEAPKRIIRAYLPKISPSEGDFIFAFHQMEYVLSSVIKTGEPASKLYRSDIKAGQLKNKILLLDRRELKCTAEEIQKVYPYPFQIVEYITIEHALRTRDDRYVIIQNSRFEASNSTYYLCNASDGAIYYEFIEPTFGYGKIDGSNLTIQVYYPALKPGQLEQFGNLP